MIAINMHTNRIAFVAGLSNREKYALLINAYRYTPKLIARNFPECFAFKVLRPITDIIDISYDPNYSANP